MDIEDEVHICRGILLSHKQEWRNGLCGSTDGPGDDHPKGKKSERERQVPMMSLLCGI